MNNWTHVTNHQSLLRFAARAPSLGQIPFTVEKAYRSAMYGRPGAAYVDLPADHIQGQVSREEIQVAPVVGRQRRMFADPNEVKRAVELLMAAKNPLVVLGKG